MLIIRESGAAACSAMASEGLLEVNTRTLSAEFCGGGGEGEFKRFLISVECSHKQLVEKIIRQCSISNGGWKRRKANVCVLLAGKQQGRERTWLLRGRGGPNWFHSIPGDAPAASRRADGMETSGPPNLH